MLLIELRGWYWKWLICTHDMHHYNVFWRPNSWLVVSDVISVNTSLATNHLLGPWCNVKWCISWIKPVDVCGNGRYWMISKSSLWYKCIASICYHIISFWTYLWQSPKCDGARFLKKKIFGQKCRKYAGKPGFWAFSRDFIISFFWFLHKDAY